MRIPLLLISAFFLHTVYAQIKPVIIAADGSGKFKTIQQAFDAVPVNNKKPVVFLLKAGVYTEKIHLDSTKDFITLRGEDRFTTIIRWDDHTGKISPKGDSINTYTSETFLLKASHCRFENLTIDNNAGFSAGQAVALQAAGDQLVFSNCRFTGNQDVLFTPKPGTRQYFTHCYIEGTTDFIFGASTAWFEQCVIFSKKNSHVTAASTPVDQLYGYVFNDCVLLGDTTLHNVSLGRPWRPYSAVVYMHCYIGAHIKPEGWSNWNNTENFKTTRYAEYKNSGPGSNPAQRVNWSKQLNEEEIKKYTLQTVLRNWLPEPGL